MRRLIRMVHSDVPTKARPETLGVDNISRLRLCEKRESRRYIVSRFVLRAAALETQVLTPASRGPTIIRAKRPPLRANVPICAIISRRWRPAYVATPARPGG